MRALGRGALWVILIFAVIALTVMIIPFRKNLGEIPVFVTSLVVLVCASILWGGGVFGRRTIVLLATGVLILSTASFFVPSLKKTLSDKANSAVASMTSQEGSKSNAPAQHNAYTPSTPTPVKFYGEPGYPAEGSGFIKKGEVIRVWFDPSNLHTRGTAPVDYMLEGHPSMKIRDNFSGRMNRKFKHFPAGRYLVTTDSAEEVHFRWWRN